MREFGWKDAMNSTCTRHKHEDMDSKAGGTKTNGADGRENESDSSLNEIAYSSEKQMLNAGSSLEKRWGIKRNGRIGLTNQAPSRHLWSLSIDGFMSKMNFVESPRPPEIVFK